MRVSRGIRPISRQGLLLGPVPLPQLKNPNNHTGQVRGDTATEPTIAQASAESCCDPTELALLSSLDQAGGSQDR
jgi:hypothetical protein